MAYEKLNLQDGQVLDAAALAHMEDGIGAGGLPAGGEPNQQLVTDENGVAQWKAQDIFVVKITHYSNWDTGENEIVSDKTYEQIVEAAKNGKIIIGVAKRVDIEGDEEYQSAESNRTLNQMYFLEPENDDFEHIPIALMSSYEQPGDQARFTGYKFTTDGVFFANDDTIYFSQFRIQGYFFIRSRYNRNLYRVGVNANGELECSIVENQVPT